MKTKIYIYGKSFWYHHPAHKNLVDVVAIPLNANIPHVKRPIPEALEHTNVIPTVGMDIFVLGFPLGIKANELPIWKRGTIASEVLSHLLNTSEFC